MINPKNKSSNNLTVEISLEIPPIQNNLISTKQLLSAFAGEQHNNLKNETSSWPAKSKLYVKKYITQLHNLYLKVSKTIRNKSSNKTARINLEIPKKHNITQLHKLNLKKDNAAGRCFTTFT